MTKKTEAKCDGMMLTAGFPAANPPLIWRFDLERNHSFTLSLQGEEGDWELGITTPKGDFYPVVHFAAREDAEEALAKVEKALTKKKRASSLIVKAMMLVGGLAAIIALGVAVFGLFIEHKASEASRPALSQISPAQAPFGVPVPADDVLKPPPQ